MKWLIIFIFFALFFGIDKSKVYAQSCGGCGSISNFILYGCGPDTNMACACDSQGYWTIREDCSVWGMTCQNGACVMSVTPTATPCSAEGFSTIGFCSNNCGFDYYSVSSVQCGTQMACCMAKTTPTALPTVTPIPTNTIVPTLVPSVTPVPTVTPVPIPTSTPRPTTTITNTVTPGASPSAVVTAGNSVTPISTTTPLTTIFIVLSNTPGPPTAIPTFSYPTYSPSATPEPVSPTATIAIPTVAALPPIATSNFCNGDARFVKSALGCLPVDMQTFVTVLLPYFFGIAGGIAFLRMSYGFVMIATSDGNPKLIAENKEIITSAVIGLLMCIFAIFICRMILVGILKLPGLE